MALLEIACNNLISCQNALEGGADRIELFENLADGGCTPSAAMIARSSHFSVPVYVMIRPRGGHFVYSKEEKDIMLEEVAYCQSKGVKGIVFGALTEQGDVDVDFCRELLNLWRGPATFHRAIDRSRDILRSSKVIADLGFERILSSGGYSDVMQGLDTLKKMNDELGGHLVVMPGAGVNPDNARQILAHTGCKEIHATCKTTHPSNTGNFSNNIYDELCLSNKELVRQLKNVVG